MATIAIVMLRGLIVMITADTDTCNIVLVIFMRI